MTTYRELTARAKVACLDIFINEICPYDDGDFDNTTALEDIEYSVEQVLETGNYFIDSSGNWFEEGEKDEI